METDCRYSSEPPVRWNLEDFRSLLLWAVQEQDAEDVTLVPRRPIWLQRHGKWLAVTQRSITSDEIGDLLNGMTDSASATAQVTGGKAMDFSYELRADRFTRLRFRARATAVPDRGSSGFTITLRSIPGLPPKLSELDIEDEILEVAFPHDGLVLITGVMGTGKSTLIASLLRELNETEPLSIVTYEQPVEFDLQQIPNPLGPLAPCEIPRDLRSFSDAPPDAARRAADVILVGESRDPETMRGMLELAEMGVAAYSTVHTQSVAVTPTRIINRFPAERQNLIATTLLSSLRLIVQQRLLPRKDGQGRVAVREFLALDDELRHELTKIDKHELIPALHQHVQERGQTMREAVQAKYQKGLISRATMDGAVNNVRSRTGSSTSLSRMGANV